MSTHALATAGQCRVVGCLADAGASRGRRSQSAAQGFGPRGTLEKPARGAFRGFAPTRGTPTTVAHAANDGSGRSEHDEDAARAGRRRRLRTPRAAGRQNPGRRGARAHHESGPARVRASARGPGASACPDRAPVSTSSPEENLLFAFVFVSGDDGSTEPRVSSTGVLTRPRAFRDASRFRVFAFSRFRVFAFSRFAVFARPRRLTFDVFRL